jgi:transposase
MYNIIYTFMEVRMASLQRRKNKGKYYWYVVESKRINGKPTPVVVAYLGTIENILSKFSSSKSNDNFKYKSYSHGAVYMLWKIAKKNNIVKIMDSILPDKKRNGLTKGMSLLLSAIHRAVHPGSKREFSEWASRTTLPSIAGFDPKKLTSQHFWDQMDGITEDMITRIEDEITKQIFSNYNFNIEKLALDYTNYFTYIASSNVKSELAQRGHNKQKRNDLRQVSLALITTKELMMPMCSYVYEGNINDMTVFPKYINMLKDRLFKYNHSKEITVIFDKGNNSKGNFRLIEDLQLNYVCSFSLNSCKELIDIPLDNYTPVNVADKDILSYRTQKIIWGKERECILAFSQDLKDGQIRGLDKEISDKLQELAELKEKLNSDKSRISRKMVDIENRVKNIVSGNHGTEIIQVEYIGKRIVKDIRYSINKTAYDDICKKNFGKKLYITNRKDWTTEEILEAYFGQSKIEDIFKDTKDPMHFAVRPQFHWTDTKIRVHIFCCLLGLMLTCLIRKELINKGIKIENDRLIEELSEIRETYILNPNKSKKSGFDVKKVLEEMTEYQKIIWDNLQEII